MIVRWIVVGGMLIQLAGAIVVTFYVARASLGIVRGEGSDKARQIIAEGVLAALGFMVAGTLLSTLALQTGSRSGPSPWCSACALCSSAFFRRKQRL